MRRYIFSLLGLRDNGDTQEGKNGAHHGFVVAEVMRHATIGMDCEVVGISECVLLMRGELKHDSVEDKKVGHVA